MSRAIQCARHPEALASASCERCGDFLCGACIEVSPWDRDMVFCAACVARMEEARGGAIPWESQGFPLKRFLRTADRVLFSPGAFFGRLSPNGPIAPAVTFGYWVSFLESIFMVLGIWLLLKRFLGPYAGTAISSGVGKMALVTGIAVVLTPIVHALSAGWLHAHIWLVGGRGPYRATFRLTAYTSVTAIPLAVVTLTSAFIAWQVMAILACVIGLYGLSIATVAVSRVHDLSGGRAFVATLLTGAEGFALCYALGVLEPAAPAMLG